MTFARGSYDILLALYIQSEIVTGQPLMENNSNQAMMKESVVKMYSKMGSSNYEDPCNKNFLYGNITIRFLEQVSFEDKDKVVLDMGCGTGFAFDVLYDQFLELKINGIGVEPAKGMLDIAIEKYKNNKLFSFHEGSFEKIPLPDGSVDRVISTLALHWVKSLEVAAKEIRRVLKDEGSVDILMIAKDDGGNFKKSIVAALRKHLSFSQIMNTATLVQRVNTKQLKQAFDSFFAGFDVNVKKFNDIVYGSFDDHMKWWKARSTPVISEVENKNQFMHDLREELEKIKTEKGIPFDTAYFWITIRRK